VYSVGLIYPKSHLWRLFTPNFQSNISVSSLVCALTNHGLVCLQIFWLPYIIFIAWWEQFVVNILVFHICSIHNND